MYLRRALAALLVVGFGVVAAACDVSVSPYAARVNGETISPGSVFSAVDAIDADADFRCVLRTDPSGSVAVNGTGQRTYNARLAASVLTTLVDSRILDHSLSTQGLQATGFDKQIAEVQLGAALNPSSTSTCSASGANVLNKLQPSYRDALVEVQVDNDLIGAQLAGFRLNSSSIRSFGAAHPRLTDQACISAIEVANAANAAKVEGAIHGGQKFASAAKQYSLNAGAKTDGGKLGCYQPLQFAPPFDSVVQSLAVGATSKPVSFQGDYVVIHIDSRQPATTAQVALAALSDLSAREQGEVTRLERQANVQVSPDFGYWGATKGSWQVIPPAGPTNGLVPNAAAITPSVNADG